MPPKQLIFNDLARQALLRGIQTISRAVKVTLGPKGRNVAIDKKFAAPAVTKDGASVAREIELEKQSENLGARLTREAAGKTSDTAGDGTTTATILVEAIFREGLKHVTAGANPICLQRGIQQAVEAAVAHLAKISKKVKDHQEIKQIAMVAANGDEAVGEIIAEAIEKVGKEGAINIEQGQTLETSLKVVRGMQFDRGYISSYFVTDAERMESVLEDAYILICEQKITTLKEIFSILEKIATSRKPLLIIAEELEGEALATLVVNKLRGTIQVCAVKAPGYGEHRKAIMRDIAILTGGKCLTADLGLRIKDVSLADLGHAKSIVVGRDTTTIFESLGMQAEIQGRLNQIRREIEETTSDPDQDILRERLAKLSTGVAIITVGASTETEMKEKKGRVNDALSATRAAIEEGLVPGGGVALLRCLPAIAALTLEGDERIGAGIIQRAIESPLFVLASNAGAEASLVVQEVKRRKGNEGFNVVSGQYEDLLKAGVVDPKKVTRSALQNAASIAGLLLGTECLITEQPPKKN